jgi:hypothetical protein
MYLFSCDFFVVNTHYSQNVVFFRVWYKFVNLIQPFLFHYNLQFVLIEMLDKLITYIVCWYNTLYQVSSVAWTNRMKYWNYITLMCLPAQFRLYGKEDIVQSRAIPLSPQCGDTTSCIRHRVSDRLLSLISMLPLIVAHWNALWSKRG